MTGTSPFSFCIADNLGYLGSLSIQGILLRPGLQAEPPLQHNQLHSLPSPAPQLRIFPPSPHYPLDAIPLSTLLSRLRPGPAESSTHSWPSNKTRQDRHAATHRRHEGKSLRDANSNRASRKAATRRRRSRSQPASRLQPQTSPGKSPLFRPHQRRQALHAHGRTRQPFLLAAQTPPLAIK